MPDLGPNPLSTVYLPIFSSQGKRSLYFDVMEAGPGYCGLCFGNKTLKAAGAAPREGLESLCGFVNTAAPGAENHGIPDWFELEGT